VHFQEGLYSVQSAISDPMSTTLEFQASLLWTKYESIDNDNTIQKNLTLNDFHGQISPRWAHNLLDLDK
jgi:hypothetical protein